MEVTLAVLADCANLTQDGKLNVMGMFGELNLPSLPFQVPAMAVVLILAPSPVEIGFRQPMRITLVTADDRELIRMDNYVDVPECLRTVDWAVIHSIIGFNGITFTEPGTVRFLVEIADVQKSVIPLRVNGPATG